METVSGEAKFDDQLNVSQTNKEYATYLGIQNWLKSEYEHLGWMALDLARKEYERPYAYTQSLKRLEKTIDERKKLLNGENNTSMDKNKSKDLDVLSYKLENLMNFAKTLGIDEKILKKNLKETICVEETVEENKEKDKDDQEGGAKKRGAKKTSKKSSKKVVKKPSKKAVKKTSKKAVKKTSKKSAKKIL